MDFHRYINFKFNEAAGVGKNLVNQLNSGRKLVNQLNSGRKLLVFTYIFVYFYIFTDILTKSYWARCSGGLGKNWYI